MVKCLCTDMSNGTSIVTNGVEVKSNPRGDSDSGRHCHVCDDKL